MANKVHVEKFLRLLQKATLNWSIPHVRVTFSKDAYKVSMKGSNCLLMLNGVNDIITGIRETDTWEMNFQDAVKNVKSYLSIIIPDEEGYADIQMKDEKIIIKSGNQKTECFFCIDSIPNVTDKEGPKEVGDEIANFEIDEELITAFALVKKVAGAFGKVYFGSDGGKLFMEAGDRTAPHSNNMMMKIHDTDYGDMFSCFDYKSLNDIMVLMGTQAYDFSFRFGYLPKRNSGLIAFTKGEEEAYYLLSLRENV